MQWSIVEYFSKEAKSWFWPIMLDHIFGEQMMPLAQSYYQSQIGRILYTKSSPILYANIHVFNILPLSLKFISFFQQFNRSVSTDIYYILKTEKQMYFCKTATLFTVPLGISSVLYLCAEVCHTEKNSQQQLKLIRSALVTVNCLQLHHVVCSNCTFVGYCLISSVRNKNLSLKGSRHSLPKLRPAFQQIKCFHMYFEIQFLWITK